MYLIYLATDDNIYTMHPTDWSTIYLTDSVPDFCAIQTAYPLITLYDVIPAVRRVPLHAHTQFCYDWHGLLRCGRVAGVDDE